MEIKGKEFVKSFRKHYPNTRLFYRLTEVEGFKVEAFHFIMTIAERDVYCLISLRDNDVENIIRCGFGRCTDKIPRKTMLDKINSYQKKFTISTFFIKDNNHLGATNYYMADNNEFTGDDLVGALINLVSVYTNTNIEGFGEYARGLGPYNLDRVFKHYDEIPLGYETNGQGENDFSNSVNTVVKNNGSGGCLVWLVTPLAIIELIRFLV